MNAKLAFLLCLLNICWSYEFQRYDGWYNHPRGYGVNGASLIYKARPAYADGTRTMGGSNRPSAGLLSDKIFSGPDGLPSSRNLSALFSFFGQLVAGEIVSTISSGEIACPVEKTSMNVGDYGRCWKSSNDTTGGVTCDSVNVRKIPFFRVAFDRNAGRHFNVPRKPINHVTSFVDGNFVYGISQPWCDNLRTFVDGKLLMDGADYDEHDDDLPQDDRVGLPAVNLPHPEIDPDSKSILSLGSFKNNQHPPLQTLNILFHRWHNVLASDLKLKNPFWQDEQLFQRARQWVIASYKAGTDPSITVEFQTSAFRFGHSLLPSGFFITNQNCDKFEPISLCSTWWNSSAFVKKTGFKSILLGMVSQRAEKGDHILSQIMRKNMFGLMRTSGQDLGALNIMRGRDEGVADYNTVRHAYGLPIVKEWKEINPELAEENPEVFNLAALLYNNSLNDIDLFVGGLLETKSDELPGATFRAILIDQFVRIRDGDRFWFENKENGLFKDSELEEIRKIKLFDVLVRAGNLQPNQTSTNAFLYEWTNVTQCHQPFQISSSVLTPCEQKSLYDYFTGSEISFVLTFLFLAFVPLVCCFVGWLIAKHKAYAFRRSLARSTTKRLKNAFIALEQIDLARSRKVQIKFGPDHSIMVLNKEASTVRAIDLNNRSFVELRFSIATKNHAAILLNVPKEYDLVLVFQCFTDRKEFALALTEFLQSLSIQIKEIFLPRDTFYSGAVMYSHRQKVLQNFFRTAFDQVFRSQKKHSSSFSSWPNYVKSVRANTSSPKKHARQLLTTELSRLEFAEALHLTPGSLFVKQMFTLADKDQNGYISYPEFIDILALLSKGTLETKMKILFDMYDFDGSNDLDEHEFSTMIRSLMDLSNNNLSKSKVDEMVHSMLSVCDLDKKSKLTFDDFYLLIQRYQTQLWCELNETGFGFTKKEKDLVDNKPLISPHFVVEPTVEEANFVRLYRFWLYKLENNANKIVILVLFVLGTTFLFVDGAITCYFMKEHTGVRKIVGKSACVARASATALSFCYGLLLLSVCRNFMTRLRNTALGAYIPFDSAISFHRLVAWVSLFLTVVHMVAHAINFYKIGTQPPIILRCVFPALQLDMDYMPNFSYWIFETVPGITGVILTVLLSVMYVFGSHTARRHIFHTFWITHRLFTLVYALTILHGTVGLIQPPGFHLYAVGPIILYVLNWIMSLRSRGIELKILEAEILPSDVLHLSFKLPPSVSFYSGQYIRLACEEISVREFHPFTITSAPYERRLSCHIRAVGPWTRSLLDLFSAVLAENKPFPQLFMDGPFGSTHQDWYKFEVVVLIGAGIGVTPNSSVLKDLVHKVYSLQSEIACRHVYFAWVARNHTQFEWFMDVLRDVEKRDVQNLIRMDIFITEIVKDFDIRTTMLYICEHQFQRLSNRSMFTGLKAKTHFGRIDFDQYLATIQQRHFGVPKIGVFSCGPKSLVRSVNTACVKINNSKHGPTLLPHHEIF